MLKEFLLVAIASLVMVPALADKPSDKGNKGGSSVLLGVVFCEGKNNPIEDLCDLTDYNFASDNRTAYIDGEESVSTSMDKFRFGLNVGLYGERHFRLDLTECFEPPKCSAPVLAGDNKDLTFGWNVFATSPDGAQYLKMPVDSSKPVNLQLDFFDDPNREQNWRIMFNPGLCPDSVNYPVKMARVTRVADDIWVFEAGTDNYACLELRKGGRKHYTYHGLYKLPFKIIATVLP